MEFPEIYHTYGKDLSYAIKTALVHCGYSSLSAVLRGAKNDKKPLYEKMARYIYAVGNDELGDDHFLIDECKKMIVGEEKASFELGPGDKDCIEKFFELVKSNEEKKKLARLERWPYTAKKQLDYLFGTKLLGGKLPRVEYDPVSAQYRIFCTIDECPKSYSISCGEKYDGNNFYQHYVDEHPDLVEESKAERQAVQDEAAAENEELSEID